MTLQIPPLERWTESLTRLTPMQRTRFEELELFEMLQREIATRLAHLPQPPS